MADDRGVRAVIADFAQISKLRIFGLLVVVAWAAMFVAADGLPDGWAFAAVTLAGLFSTASSGAFNNVLERHRDARMQRTASRPVASGRLAVRHAVLYGAVTALLSFAALAVLGLWLAAALTLAAIAYYVIVYTVVLKPATPQNIVIGGFAGSFPALIGWAAQAGDLAWPAAAPAFLLALLVLLWTPAHFWSLALLYQEDYAAADYPMLPNVKGEAATRTQILLYSVLTLASSLALVPLGAGSWLYLAAALFLGAVLVVRAGGLIRSPGEGRYRAFFLYSIQYLGFLLLALMADRVVPQPAMG